MSNFVVLSRSALYAAMASGQEIYVFEGGKLHEIRQYGVMSKRTARRKLAFIRESFTGEPVTIRVIK